MERLGVRVSCLRAWYDAEGACFALFKMTGPDVQTS